MLSIIKWIEEQYKNDGATKVNVEHRYKNIFYVIYNHEDLKYRCEEKIKVRNKNIEVLMVKA